MIRRLLKPAITLMTIGSVIFTVPPEFLEAVTANLNTLIATDGSITEGDKTFSNFSFTPLPLGSGTGGVLTLPSAGDITVTASTGADGSVTLSFAPFGLSASGNGDLMGFISGLVSFGFDVMVTGSDVISAVSVDASVVQSGPLATASVDANVSPTGGTSLGLITTSGIDTLSVPDLQAVTVEATAGVLVDLATEMAAVNDVAFTFDQTTPMAPVPEAGSLTLMLGGAGVLLARRLYKRRG